MKIRIGIGLGAAAGPAGFAGAVSHLEELGIDSLWLSEMVYGPMVEPFTGMTYALARTARLKVGTGVSVLPGRHPVLVAKQLATLAGLAPGRVLPVFGLQPARRDERGLFPLPRKPLDIWLGGSAPAGLRRVGRLGDGWLASFVTPAEAHAGRGAIQQAAAAAGREVDPEHFGISLPVAMGGIPAGLAEAIRRRRPDADPASLVATSWPGARRMIEEYIAAGISKFVIRPAAAPEARPAAAPEARPAAPPVAQPAATALPAHAADPPLAAADGFADDLARELM